MEGNQQRRMEPDAVTPPAARKSVTMAAAQNVKKRAEMNQTGKAFSPAWEIVARRLPAALADKSAVTGPCTAE